MQITKSYQQNPTPENLSRLQTYDVWLKQLGEGILPTIQESIISLDSTMTVPHPDDVSHFVYNNIQEQISNPAYFQQCAILTSTNETVNTINEQILEQLSTPLHTWTAINTIMDPDQVTSFPLNSWILLKIHPCHSTSYN